jgi:hypothetical protein
MPASELAIDQLDATDLDQTMPLAMLQAGGFRI